MTDNLLSATTGDNDVTTMPPIPEKFIDKDTGALRTEALLSSYLALEKHLGRMVPLPENDDDKARFYKILGRPDTPDQYDITLASDVIELDPALNERLHRNGFTNAQVQEIYDLAAEKLVPLLLEMAAEYQSEREIERLEAHFGGADAWREMARQLKDFGQKTLPQAAYEGLACSYDGVLALHRMMRANTSSVTGPRDVTSASAPDEASLKKMMQNPKYWRERDPAFIAEVSAGFERIFGNNS
ncbi:MAG: hypothetical protein WC043_10760 [Pseudobdellovibrionaceae bacterium]